VLKQPGEGLLHKPIYTIQLYKAGFFG